MTGRCAVKLLLRFSRYPYSSANKTNIATSSMQTDTHLCQSYNNSVFGSIGGSSQSCWGGEGMVRKHRFGQTKVDVCQFCLPKSMLLTIHSHSTLHPHFSITTVRPSFSISHSFDLPCDLPCAASPANHRPARPRAQRTSPHRSPSGYS